MPAAKKASPPPPSARSASTAAAPGSTSRPSKRSPRTRRSRHLAVAVEAGPKKKKFAAFALEWPGLERGGRSAEAAVDELASYVARYAAVAKLAGLAEEYAATSGVDVVERYEGTGSTDFWGISFAFAKSDTGPWSAVDLERELSLLRACWKYFDQVRGRVSAEMQKGVRGGGRDRDRIVQHTVGVEQDWATKLGIRLPPGTVVLDPKGLRSYRRDFVAAIRAFHQ